MKRDYTEEEIRRGLTELALCAGSARAAADRLRQQGYPVPKSTLDQWMRSTYPERYAEVQGAIVTQLHERIAEDCERNAIRQGELALELTARLADELDAAERLKPHEAAGALRNLETAKAINVDKSQLLRGKPTGITEHRHEPSEVLKRIAERFNSVDSTAEELFGEPDQLQARSGSRSDR